MIPWYPKGPKWTQTTSPSAQGEQRDMQSLPEKVKVENHFSSNKFSAPLEVPRKRSSFCVRPLVGTWDQFSAQGNTGERYPPRKPCQEPKVSSFPFTFPWLMFLLVNRDKTTPSLLADLFRKLFMPWRHLATTWLNCTSEPGQGFLHFSSFPEEQMLLDGLQPNFAGRPLKTHHYALKSLYFSIYIYI